MVFDCLYSRGRDLRREPLVVRQQELLRLPASPIVHRVEAVDGAGRALYRVAGASGLEGIVAKRRDAPYESGRSAFWRKIKCWRRIRCLVLGVEEAKGEIRSVRLGVEQDGVTLAVGAVGGIGKSAQEDLRRALAQGRTFVDVLYLDWTETGSLRHPRWLGIALDGGGQPGTLA
jgi:bifunctional non-homologous end joining protein LigD